jgi:sRNA-binding regulator protein Hfq
MKDIIIKRLSESEGKTITFFLHNNFRYTGKCLNSDDSYVEILDYKTDKIMVFDISEIKTLGVGE